MKRLPFLCAIALAAETAGACEDLQVRQAWIREAPPGAAVMAGYAQLHNTGKQSLTLDGARSPSFGQVEIHRMETDQGQMRMRAEPRLLLEPDATVSLEPGGLHLMLMAPKQPLKAGQPVTIKFDCGPKSIAADFTVQAQP
jgi:periplasmic copper chaperone A